MEKEYSGRKENYEGFNSKRLRRQQKGEGGEEGYQTTDTYTSREFGREVESFS